MKCNTLCESEVLTKKGKIVRLNSFWGIPKVRRLGKPKDFVVLYKERKVRENKDFFLGKTCELLFVRGTTSFYNKKLQFFPVGEGVVWNVRM